MELAFGVLNTDTFAILKRKEAISFSPSPVQAGDGQETTAAAQWMRVGSKELRDFYLPEF